MKRSLDFFTGNKIVGKPGIESILPHRGRMLLLDNIDITEKRVLGGFRVTDEVCEGHRVLDGKEILKGSDLFDMAAQLLVVSWVVEQPELQGKIYLPRKYEGVKFRKPIFPGELLVLEIKIEDVRAEILKKEEGGDVIFLTGERFLAKVDKETRAEVSGVYLAIL